MKKANYLSLLLIFTLLLCSPMALFAQSINTSKLNFKNLEGGAVALSGFQGKIVVLSFSAKGLPLNQTELPQLEKLASKYANQSVVVIWASTNSQRPKTNNYASDDDLRTLANQYPHLRILRDAESSAYHQIGADTLPTILLIDQNGKLVGNPHAGIDPQANLVNDLSTSINRLLAQ